MGVPVHVDEMGADVPVRVDVTGTGVPVGVDEMGADVPVRVDVMGAGVPVGVDEMGLMRNSQTVDE